MYEKKAAHIRKSKELRREYCLSSPLIVASYPKECVFDALFPFIFLFLSSRRFCSCGFVSGLKQNQRMVNVYVFLICFFSVMFTSINGFK